MTEPSNGNEQPFQPQLQSELSADAIAALEALLFAAAEPLELSVIARVLEWTPATVDAALDALQQRLVEERRGMVVTRHEKAAQLSTAPRFGPLIARLLSVERTVRISEAALETLAIIAYRQPITRAEIEAVRGVDSSGVLSTLVARELIEIAGRRATPGNPLEYETTDVFLRHFGIASLGELPSIEEV